MLERQEQKGNEMQPIKYVAEVAPVKEVTLHGLADLAYWRDKLAAENLQPLKSNERAQVIISATEAKFWGITFRELLIGIHVQPTSAMPAGMPAMYLIQAWNSVSAFAWIERMMFGTPYATGKIAVDPRYPSSLQLSQRAELLVAADMSGEQQRKPAEVVEENWHGAIFLPRRKGAQQKLFIAKLAGTTEHFPFRSGDSFTLARGKNCPVIDWLADSHFTPQAWHVRQTAAHAKSKTYRADRFFAG